MPESKFWNEYGSVQDRAIFELVLTLDTGLFEGINLKQSFKWMDRDKHGIKKDSPKISQKEVNFIIVTFLHHFDFENLTNTPFGHQCNCIYYYNIAQIETIV